MIVLVFLAGPKWKKKMKARWTTCFKRRTHKKTTKQWILTCPSAGLKTELITSAVITPSLWWLLSASDYWYFSPPLPLIRSFIPLPIYFFICSASLPFTHSHKTCSPPPSLPLPFALLILYPSSNTFGRQACKKLHGENKQVAVTWTSISTLASYLGIFYVWWFVKQLMFEM